MFDVHGRITIFRLENVTFEPVSTICQTVESYCRSLLQNVAWKPTDASNRPTDGSPVRVRYRWVPLLRAVNRMLPSEPAMEGAATPPKYHVE